MNKPLGHQLVIMAAFELYYTMSSGSGSQHPHKHAIYKNSSLIDSLSSPSYTSSFKDGHVAVQAGDVIRSWFSPYGEWDPDDEWGVHNDECWQCEGPYWEICDDADWQNQTCPDPQCQWRYDPTWEMSWCFRYIDRGFTYMPPMSLGLSL